LNPKLSDVAERRTIEGYYDHLLDHEFQRGKFLVHHAKDHLLKKAHEEGDKVFTTAEARAHDEDLPKILDERRQTFEQRLHEAFKVNAERRRMDNERERARIEAGITTGKYI
jgi:hypothetical protein